MRIVEGDEENTTYDTRYDRFEFFSIPLSSVHSLTSFYTLMNEVFRPFLDKFLVIYLDDIMVFKERMEENEKHLVEVFEALRHNNCN
jgi:hypothetical protein